MKHLHENRNLVMQVSYIDELGSVVPFLDAWQTHNLRSAFDEAVKDTTFQSWAEFRRRLTIFEKAKEAIL